MESASDVFEGALEFPMSDDDWLVTILVGGLMVWVYNFLAFVTQFVFVTLPLLLVPLFLLQGYIVAAIRETLAGEDLPEWGDAGWGDMLGDGGKVWVVTIGYVLLPFVATLVLLLGAGFPDGAAGESAGSTVASTGRSAAALVLVVGSLVVTYVLPAATVNFAREDSLAAGFDVDAITDVVLTGDYLLGWLLVLGIGVLWFVASIVVSLTFVGIFFLPWVAFFFGVSVFYVFARAYAGALDIDIPLADVEPVEAGGGEGSKRSSPSTTHHDRDLPDDGDDDDEWGGDDGFDDGDFGDAGDDFGGGGRE